MKLFVNIKFNKETIFCFAILVAFLIGFLMINFIAPMITDDYLESSFQKLDLLSSFKRAYRAARTEYSQTMGRIVPAFLRFFLLAWNMFFVNVVNSLMAISLGYLIFLHAYLRHPKNLFDGFVLILILGLVWFFPEHSGEVLFSKTISIHYLWAITTMLCFIYYYRLLIFGKDNMPDSACAGVAFFVTGLLLGTWLENLSIAVIIFLLAIICYLKIICKKKIKTWVWLGCLGYVIGTVILIAASGNYKRIRVGGGYGPPILEKIIPFTETVFYHYVHQIKEIFQTVIYYIPAIKEAILFFVKYFIPILIFTIFVSAVVKFKRCKTFFIFFVLAGVSAFAMIGAPNINFIRRTAFVSDIFFIIAVISLIPSFSIFFQQLHRTKLVLKVILGSFSMLILYCFIMDMIITYEAYRVHNVQNKLREKWIHKNLLNGNKDILLSSIYFDPHSRSRYSQGTTDGISVGTSYYFLQYKGKGKYFFPEDITSDVNRGSNRYYSRYYGLNSVKLVSAKDVISYDFIKNYAVSIRQPFAVVVRSNKVYYINTKYNCSDLSNKSSFFLRVYPKFARNASKAHSLNFIYDSSNQAMVLSNNFKKPVNNVCVFVARLPFYPISKIKTGQYKDSTIYWEKEIFELDEAGQGNFDSSKLSDWWNNFRY